MARISSGFCPSTNPGPVRPRRFPSTLLLGSEACARAAVRTRTKGVGSPRYAADAMLNLLQLSCRIGRESSRRALPRQRRSPCSETQTAIRQTTALCSSVRRKPQT
jgi:hypothetical protein